MTPERILSGPPAGERRSVLRYHDTGSGFQEGTDFNQGKSLGMRLIFSLSRQLNAEIELTGTDGFKLNLFFPIEEGEALAAGSRPASAGKLQ